MTEPLFTLVPVVPTEAMVEAGRSALAQQDPIHVSHARVIWLWNDMLEAAQVKENPWERK